MLRTWRWERQTDLQTQAWATEQAEIRHMKTKAAKSEDRNLILVIELQVHVEQSIRVKQFRRSVQVRRQESPNSTAERAQWT